MAENEERSMMCEDCGQNEAVCTVAVMAGTQVMHRRLCQACMAKASMSIASGNLGSVLGAIMAAARNAAQQAAMQNKQPASTKERPAIKALPELPGEAEACPQCGMTYHTFRTEARLGCAACARAFRQTLMVAARRDGVPLQHTGRKPLTSSEAVRSRARQMELQRQMDEAIEREDYETAARIRDTLRALNGQEGSTDE